MDTKRFSEEDLAPGLQANNVQAGNGLKKEEDNQIKKESSNKKTETNLGKKAATAGVAFAGGAALGAAAMAINEHLNSEDADVASPTTATEATHGPAHIEPEPEVVDTIDIKDDGKVEIKGWDDDGDGKADRVTGNLTGDETPEIEIRPIDDEGNGYVVEQDPTGDGIVDVRTQYNEDGTAVSEVDLNGDGIGDVQIYHHDDGTSTMIVENDENVINVSDCEPSNEPEPTDEPIAFVSDDPENLFNDDPVVPSELDENGDLLAQEFEDDDTQIDSCFEDDTPNEIDDLNVDIDMI